MKTNLTFAVILFIQFSLIGQYVPFPDSIAGWSMKIDYYSENFNYNNRAGYLHEITGDTMFIDGQSYLKVYQRDTWYYQSYTNETPDSIIQEIIAQNVNGIPRLIGGMRQDIDQKKVYFIRPSDLIESPPTCIDPFEESVFPLDEEFLLFDFDLEVGDTVTLGGGQGQDFYITQIDSVQYNDGIFRKRYLAGNSFPDFRFIEGIGTSRGLFAPLRGEFVEGHFCDLTCFTVDQNYVIGTSVYNCDSIDVVTPTIEINNQSNLHIFPNPFNEFIKVELKSSTKNTYEIIVRDLLGRMLKNESMVENEFLELKTDSFKPGVYFISIYSDGQLISSQKLLKLD